MLMLCDIIIHRGDFMYLVLFYLIVRNPIIVFLFGFLIGYLVCHLRWKRYWKKYMNE